MSSANICVQNDAQCQILRIVAPYTVKRTSLFDPCSAKLCEIQQQTPFLRVPTELGGHFLVCYSYGHARNPSHRPPLPRDRGTGGLVRRGRVAQSLRQTGPVQ